MDLCLYQLLNLASKLAPKVNNPLAFIDPLGLANRLATEEELAVFREAAIFSFGERNGAALMDFVTVKFATPDEAEVDVGDVSARGSYDWFLNEIKIYARDIDNVVLHLVRRSTFVHELTHAWQDVTQYQNPSGSGSPNPDDRYEHTIFQLFFRQLDSEQMARAVQNHYHAMHSNPNTFGRAGYVFSWWVNAGGEADEYLSHQEMVNIASSVLYVPLLNMIREPLIGAATWGVLEEVDSSEISKDLWHIAHKFDVVWWTVFAHWLLSG